MRDGTGDELGADANRMLEVALAKVVAAPDGGAVPERAVESERIREEEEIGKGGTRGERDRDETLVTLLEADGMMLADMVDTADGLIPVLVAGTKVVSVEFRYIVVRPPLGNVDLATPEGTPEVPFQ